MNRQDEIEYLKRRGDLFFTFISSKTSDVRGLNEFKMIFTQLHTAKDLKGLREMNKEVDIWSRNLPTQQDSIEFWKVLKSELGEDYPSGYEKQIQSIKKKGIQKEFEYHLIEERVSELCQAEDSDSEIEELNFNYGPKALYSEGVTECEDCP